ncbi:helix-turn-helix transcriptional regulator [Pseudomaricurvus alkylphenolicus]|uniref:helix-turn-helix domain-containing protein n=1 Tax=Pseudomaricurvus alkylphenolicus TaxID=1306991 RepID=UPI00142352AD|nr:helix-turn-helix transcriptional regulator [Pseudomaricurvus alkylphenolicus]
MQKDEKAIPQGSEIELLGSLGDRLRHLLNCRDLSVTDLARELNISRQSCYKWLRHSAISDSNLHRLADFFEVSPEWIKFGVADLYRATSQCDVEACLSNCALKQNFIVQHQQSELIWELCLERKSLIWYGDSHGVFGIDADSLPADLARLVSLIGEDYRDIFLRPLRQAILSSELATVLVPICDRDGNPSRWLNCTLHANCAGKMIVGSFSATEMRRSPRLERDCADA